MTNYRIKEIYWDNWEAYPGADYGFLQLRLDVNSCGGISYDVTEIEGLYVGLDDNDQPCAFEIELFQQWYPDLIRQLKATPLPYRFDLLEAGLYEATMEQVLRWVYARFVGRLEEAPVFTELVKVVTMDAYRDSSISYALPQRFLSR